MLLIWPGDIIPEAKKSQDHLLQPSWNFNRLSLSSQVSPGSKASPDSPSGRADTLVLAIFGGKAQSG